MRITSITCLALGLMFLAPQGAPALTIYDIQYSSPPDYESPYVDQFVDVTGGVVIKIFVGGRTKIAIQDPTLGDAWAGVQIVFDEHEMAAGISRGDRIDLYNVEVYESRGNTQLGFSDTSSVVIVSSGNPVDPLVVTPADIPYPTDNDMSEKWEFMLLQLEDVCVGAMDLGSHADNYELSNAYGTCWASDYANYDLPPGSDYFVTPSECFISITGYLEQYLNTDDGWDYYQLLPRDIEDYVLPVTPTRETTWGAVKSVYK
ncbi:MAG: hypothetical protein KJ970_17660 [Candidatus Eisenbacteria bacterium]|uniref:Uncharacterized protein n=1 Tax=Eiseniibacteriota bacterium TaxID=2212470 RepID=A0A948RZZ6_UNCEI|nr:hypothetical protein [Candidatus Eisenbacteria bacterium]MBU1951241.1 hypothetical protein [Candidatus Eisenbacteria bacterium]MBU2692747.1 hypothetical protein [Candidatus Eisenbacteria bacterium]